MYLKHIWQNSKWRDEYYLSISPSQFEWIRIYIDIHFDHSNYSRRKIGLLLCLILKIDDWVECFKQSRSMGVIDGRWFSDRFVCDSLKIKGKREDYSHGIRRWVWDVDGWV